VRVAVNVVASYRGAAGIGRYAANVAESLLRCGRDIGLVLLIRRGSGFGQRDLPGSVALVECRPTGPMWEQLQVPGILERHAVDIYHSPLFLCPVARACKQIITVHDAIPERLPDQTPSDFLRLHRRYFAPCLRAADAVLTVSRYSERDIVETLPKDGKPVYAAYQALSEQFGRENAAAGHAGVRRKLGLPERFVLYVGSIEPRKRILELVDAFAVLAGGRPGLSLVLAGRRLFSDYDPEAHAADRGVADRVTCLGYVDDGDLPGLYAAASVFAFPSAYEGFGLPVTEAMACGCPVVTAGNSSLPEAGGEAALYADPADADAFAEALLRLLEEGAERERRIRLGLEHVKQFSMEKFAERLLQVYRRVLKGGEA
jgi:glycosyltransferase involved in cell wall biosynthesis